MKNLLYTGIALGVMIGAVGVSLCKPAQKFVQNTTEAVKEEAQTFIKNNMEN